MECKIKFYRLQKGYNLRYLSRKSGVSVSYLSDLENGVRTNPSVNTVFKIAKALGVNITDIYKQ